MKPLLDEWSLICQKLRKGTCWFLFFDYDGTLTPIVKRPEGARLSDAVRRSLRRISKNPRFKLGIITGRSLNRVRRMSGMPEFLYAGNHGLEIRGPGLRYDAPVDPKRAEGMRRILKEVAPQLVSIPGVIIEDKGLTASLHFRLVPRSWMPGFSRVINSVLRPAAKRCGARIQEGKKVLNILPGGTFNKGSAICWIRRKIKPKAAVLFVGDDLTDEDAFQKLRPTDISVRMGKKQTSSARYYLRNASEMYRLLGKLERL